MHVFRSLDFVLRYSERSWDIKDYQSIPMLAHIFCNALFERQTKWSREIEQSLFGPVLIRMYNVYVMFLIQRSNSREFQNCSPDYFQVCIALFQQLDGPCQACPYSLSSTSMTSNLWFLQNSLKKWTYLTSLRNQAGRITRKLEILKQAAFYKCLF